MSDAQLLTPAPPSDSASVVLRLLPDDRLARRAARGDRRALEAIYRRYHQDLYRFCLAMTGSVQDAQDALQNTMVKVLRALPGEERQIKLKPWLYRIARNETVEVLRKRRDSEELEVEQPTMGTVADTAETRDRLRTLLADLEQLPQRQRAVLLMRELSGLEYAEIGTAFGTSAAVARQTLYEARLSLRQLEEGRERRCADVRRELSDADGRVLRRRKTRAHLRSCPSCRAFQAEIGDRERELAALAPLPLAASAGLLHGVLGGQASGASASGASGLAGTVGAGAGQALATSVAVKSAAAVAVAVVAVSAADRSGIVDLPLPGKDEPGAVQSASEPSPTAGGGAAGAAGPASPSADASRETQVAAGAEKHRKADGSEAVPGKHVSKPAVPSSSHAGVSPPGGGHGKSAAERQDGPEQLPSAAGQGQQTAAAQKPAQAVEPPGPPPSPAGQVKPDRPEVGPPEPPPTPPPPASSPPTPPTGPPSAQAQGPPSNPAAGKGMPPTPGGPPQPPAR